MQLKSVLSSTEAVFPFVLVPQTFPSVPSGTQLCGRATEGLTRWSPPFKARPELSTAAAAQSAAQQKAGCCALIAAGSGGWRRLFLLLGTFEDVSLGHQRSCQGKWKLWPCLQPMNTNVSICIFQSDPPGVALCVCTAKAPLEEDCLLWSSLTTAAP